MSTDTNTSAVQAPGLGTLERALHDAATSLETISRLAGRDEHMQTMLQVRGYATCRAQAAREAMASTARPSTVDAWRDIEQPASKGVAK